MIGSKYMEAMMVSTPSTLSINPVTQGVVNRMTVAGSTPSDKLKSAMDKWILREISNGNYDKSDSWYVFEMDDKIQAKVNWIDGNYDATEPVACPFTAGVGYKSDGSGYLNANFGPGDGVNFTINDNSLIFYTPDSGGNATRLIGVEDGSRDHFIQFTNATAGFYASWTNGINEAFTSTVNNGIWSVVRTVSNLTTLYQNNISKGTTTDASSVFSWTKPFFLCANNDNDTAELWDTVHTLGFVLFGSSLIDRADLEDGHDQFLIDIA